MTLRAYRVTDQARRISMQLRPDEKPYHDAREQAVDMDGARAAVRAERIRDLERLYADGLYDTFDHLLLMWHRMDTELYEFLPWEPGLHAEHALKRAGLL